MITIDTEKELLNLIAHDDEKAFKILFYNYHQKLGGYIYRLTNSVQLSQEIVQDAFLKVWANRSSLSDVNNFNSYLFAVARNHTLNVLKQIAREHSRKKAWEETQGTEHNCLAIDSATYKEMSAITTKAIDALPPRQKSVFLLSRDKGLAHEHIAEQLGISLETVKKHMVLALRSIRLHLEKNRLTILIFCFLFVL